MHPANVWTKAQQLHRQREADNTQPIGNPYDFICNEARELEEATTDSERAAEYGDLVANVLAEGARLGLNPWTCAAASQARTVGRLNYIAEHATTPTGTDGHRQEAAHLWNTAKAAQSGTIRPTG